jgi:ATP-dependent 26S proteasome regulatory subunit
VSEFAELEGLVAARMPIVAVESHEETRVVQLFGRYAQLAKRPLWRWSVTAGLARVEPAESAFNTTRIEDALREVEKSAEDAIFLFLDAHRFLDDPVVLRQVKDIALAAEATHRMLVFVSARLEVPQEIARMTAHFRPALPDPKRVADILNEEARRYRESAGTAVAATREALAVLVQHLGGLTEDDVRRLTRMAINDDGAVCGKDLARVLKAKHETLAGSEVLHLEAGVPDIAQLGGLAALKRWLEQRREPFLHPEPDSPLPPPKGVLLLGVQGAGKSLAAKCIAGAWQLPLFRLDFGGLYRKFQGETEANLRDALAVAGAMAPCVLWMDEIEKGISGDASGETDGGASRRILGTLLTWMSERTSRVFMVATSNDISHLPPELLRKGRFDEIFFVDLPASPVRGDILRIHLARRKLDAAGFDLAALAGASQGFSGAEIEQAVVSALYESRAAKMPVDTQMLLAEFARTKPLSVVMAEKVAGLRAWARERAVAAD